MKTTGMIFTGNHPQLILDGTKTMTRRTWGLEKINFYPDEWVHPYQLDVDPNLWTWRSTKTGKVITIKCPYGQVGDLLWVKETWTDLWMSNIDLGDVIYKATPPNPDFTVTRWKPSLFMPRWASRITREITEIRAERVQEITEKDAKAEGVVALYKTAPYTFGAGYIWTPHGYRDGFSKLWDSLNAKRGYGWERNIWVWPISF